jgi:DNA-binding PucR family transcriptional regulator
MFADGRILPFDAADAERLAVHRADREKAAGVLLSTLRTRIRQALDICDRKTRCKALDKIAVSIVRQVWPLSLADAAHLLAAEVRDAATYGGIQRLRDFVGPNP